MTCLEKQKVLKARAIAKAKNQFSVGDTVNINGRGKTLVGKILKINRTKAICLINGDKYDVPLSIMEAA